MTHRNYSSAPDRVRDNYRKMREYQNLNFVLRVAGKYNTPCSSTIGVWEALEHLDHFVDLSDPDMELPNIIHMLQTAEGIRRDNGPEWMQIVGLIHDLGKCIYLRGCDADGTSKAEQWAIVGDTFVVGDPLPDKLVYPEFNVLNSDCMSSIYTPGIGLRNVHISYGHDEYLFQMINRTAHNLPMEALYMIRFHSLYAWHRDGCYLHLEDSMDKQMKPWVQRFNQYDLYTKENKVYTESEVKQLKDYYLPLIDKYLPPLTL